MSHESPLDFKVLKNVKTKFSSMIKKDVAFLTKLGLMDYSLLVGVERQEDSNDFSSFFFKKNATHFASDNA